MGYAVAMSGDTALVATADGNPQSGDWPPALLGSILSFRRNESGWILEQEFGPSINPSFPSYVGTALDIDGDYAVAGLESRIKVIGGSVNPVGARLFQRVDGAWTEIATLSVGDENLDRSYEFGAAVAIDGQRIAVGAPKARPNGYTSGAVYIFEIGPTDVTLVATLVGDDTHLNDLVGKSVALDGDTLAFYGLPNDGASVYVFTRNPDGTWSQQDKLRPPSEELGFHQLEAVALSGNTLIAGTRATGGVINSGAVFIWDREGDTWALSQTLRPDSGGGVYEGFGVAVDLIDDVLVVGAPGGLHHPTIRPSTYIYQREAGIWHHRSTLQPADAGTTDRFGQAVATNGKESIVGAQN